MKGMKTGGRQKGTPNKRTVRAQELAEELGCDPLRVLMAIVQNDWEFLGYSSPEVTKVLKDGGTIVVDRIELDQRLQAAKEACQYLYPKLKAVEHSGSIEGEHFFVPVTRETLIDAIKNDPFMDITPEDLSTEVVEAE